MKYYALLAVFSLVLTACRKETNAPKQYRDKIVLEEIKESNGSVQLEWSVLNNPDFVRYVVYRTAQPYGNETPIGSLDNRSQTLFTDKNVPYSTAPVVYKVAGLLKNGQQIVSNEMTFSQDVIDIVLHPVTATPDSAVLTWDKVNNKSLITYIITRTIGSQPYGNQIAHIPASEAQRFVDKTFPLGFEVSYQIQAQFGEGTVLESNRQSISFTDPTITLENLDATKDSVKLTWTPSSNRAFQTYSIVRKSNALDPGTTIANVPAWARTYTDKTVPYSANVSYSISSFNGFKNTQVVSNVQVFSRPSIQELPITPFDALFDDAAHLVYLFEKEGKIMLYNTASQSIVQTISTGTHIGYCALGVYNGRKELYVPRNDGWIFIYDATNLSKIGQVSGGTDALSVVSHNNILYVSTNIYSYTNIKAISRSSGLIVSETGEWYAGRLKKIPGTQTSLLSMSISVSPVDVDRFNFGASGQFLTHINDTYHGTHPLEFYIWEIFPAGDKFITSGNGSIYKTDMTYETQLPRGSLSFRDYAFDNTGKYVYAASSAKTIESYSLPDYVHQKTYPVNIFPFKIFKSGNQLILLGTANQILNKNFSFTTFQSFVVLQYIDL